MSINSMQNHAGMVYSMTNASDCNEIMAFCRRPNGTLALLQSCPTGGAGSGDQTVDPLMSQGSLVASEDGCFLFAVNAGSNTISSFQITSFGSLTLVDQKPCGGVFPVSLAIRCGLLYVANRGDGSTIASNITGFQVDCDGCLNEIPYSTRTLSSATAQPSCIVFDDEAGILAVCERDTNFITLYEVQPDGTLCNPTVNASSGAGPFGAAFLSNNVLLVTESGTDALSSYCVNCNGTLNAISPSVPNYQLGTCWVALSQDECFAYTSNAGSNTITTYRIECGEQLRLSDIIYSTQNGAGTPLDSGVICNNLYVLNGNEGSISVFCICRDGGLIRVQTFMDTLLPLFGCQGLAVVGPRCR